ncbi:hypothetical protein [Kistimonas asteriae]|uniref:hypothetical protein n=1 Tax=Kistimonas asteriae TaxID=517724 RepID=UPI001BAB5C6A|nr:hypothetical protein [Kistimonas asteriae]
MVLELSWYKSFRIKQHIADIRSNHKRRAAMYDLLENYSRSIPSLVDVLARICRRKHEDHDSEAHVYDEILQGIKEENLSPIMAMAKMFPQDELALIQAASTRGEVHKGFARARFIAEKRAEAKSSIMMAMAYPSYIMISSVMLFYFILKQSVPGILQLLPVERWPGWTQFLHTLYLIIVEYNELVLALMMMLVAFIILTLRMGRGRVRRVLDVLPPWSVQKRVQSSVFLIALGDLIANGDSFPKAIQRLSQHAPPYLASYLAVMNERRSQNCTVSEALDCDLFDRTTTGFIKDFSHLKVFNQKIIEIGEKALAGTVTFIKTLAVILGLLGVIGVAAGNGYIALSTNTIQKSYINEIKR